MAPVLYLAVITFLVLCPFQLYPRNGVHWLSPEAGIYFDGGGIAYTELSLALEATQLLIPARAGGPVDVVVNTVGTAIGVIAFLLRSQRGSAGERMSP